jgi:glycosyltransferase involved in cell wall biosynthesis
MNSYRHTRVCVSLDARFQRTVDGRVWCGYFPYSFWTRYLDVFDEVRVLARVFNVPTGPDPSWRRADGEAITFEALPGYVGPIEYLRQFFSLRGSIRKSIGPRDAIIMRVPSHLALAVERELSRDRPVGLEVVGDPRQAFAPGTTKHPLRPFFRWWSARALTRQCKRACAVAYVTEILQPRYPPRENAFWTSYSSIELQDQDFAPAPRSLAVHPGRTRIVSVGTLETLYKGFDVLIDALGMCVNQGLDLELTIVGGGQHRAELERRAQCLGMEHRVAFTGELPAGEAVRSELDRADLFVLPSRAEGLPRVVIEAMARGLPCIGSDVGGMPELLSAEYMVPSGDAIALARKIKEALSDPSRLTRMSATNWAKARNYRNAVLASRRREFYNYLRQATEEWNRQSFKDYASTEIN